MSGVPISGQAITIIGRGRLVGRPLAALLALDHPMGNATVTVVHGQSRDLAAHTRNADIVVSAAGVPNLLSADMIKPGAAVVGVGMQWIDGTVVTDIAEDVAHVAAFVTPPYGSVGAMTRAMLMTNVVEVAERVV
jgi:methylenetetrahydrofolate dehydrogenase (NADP+)/methenyltetrahydrofolate cyclohydrolase